MFNFFLSVLNVVFWLFCWMHQDIENISSFWITSQFQYTKIKCERIAPWGNCSECAPALGRYRCYMQPTMSKGRGEEKKKVEDDICPKVTWSRQMQEPHSRDSLFTLSDSYTDTEDNYSSQRWIFCFRIRIKKERREEKVNFLMLVFKTLHLSDV